MKELIHRKRVRINYLDTKKRVRSKIIQSVLKISYNSEVAHCEIINNY